MSETCVLGVSSGELDVILTPVEDLKPARKISFPAVRPADFLQNYIVLDETALYEQPTSDTLKKQIPQQSVLIRSALCDL